MHTHMKKANIKNEETDGYVTFGFVFVLVCNISCDSIKSYVCTQSVIRKISYKERKKKKKQSNITTKHP